MSWLARLFGNEGNAPEDSLGAADLAEASQKIARTQARQGLLLEEIESKLEAGFADLRGMIGAAGLSSEASLSFDECFDALDALEEAARRGLFWHRDEIETKRTYARVLRTEPGFTLEDLHLQSLLRIDHGVELLGALGREHRITFEHLEICLFRGVIGCRLVLACCSKLWFSLASEVTGS